ncbi:MAG TPA: RNA polymerase sigma factor [Kofleriaceae bacterium]|jgi:RNA polymerase sigma-70 factor (ECF subfamily)|nr:RNA polymerase sigma factor [Kofleriaceae bacterium]
MAAVLAYEVFPVTAPDNRVAAAVAGDRRALESLVTELLPRIRNLVRYLVRGDVDADDLAQEAMVAIVRGLPSHRGEGSFEAWADRVAVRSTFAGLRRARRARAQLDAGADLAAVPHPDGPPDDYAARRAAVKLLDQIPDEQRHVLVLHHVLGLSVPEIAEELGAPFETVRSRLRIGIGKLRALSTEAPRGGTR